MKSFLLFYLSPYFSCNFSTNLRYVYETGPRSSVGLMVKAACMRKWQLYTNQSTGDLKFTMIFIWGKH